MILEDKDLWEVTAGTEARPEGVDEGLAWDKQARKALAIICLSLKDSELAHVRKCKTSKEAWDQLSQIYETKSLLNKLVLH